MLVAELRCLLSLLNLTGTSSFFYKMKLVKDDGTLLLEGACGSTFTEHMLYAVPSHIPIIIKEPNFSYSSALRDNQLRR